MKDKIKHLGIILLVALIGFTMVSCSDDDSNSDPQFYAVHYYITSTTHDTLDSTYLATWNLDGGATALAFVKNAPGSNKLGEKTGTDQEVFNFVSSRGEPYYPFLANIKGLNVGSAVGNWPSGYNYFIYVKRTK